MYPLRLYLKNFLSYGEKGVEVDFSKYHTVLLLGPNGAGKSSLLDAILWCLWGKTRAGGDTDIMHSGSSDMEVRLDFVVQDAPYRVIRKRSKKGKSFMSVVELQSLTTPITLLTEATINQTQAKIDELLGISYDILISSAFLRQGDAQEFTKKSPTKRKELLASILHLDQYQRWHEESKRYYREIENSLLGIISQKEYLVQEQERIQIEFDQTTEQLKQYNEAALHQDIVQLTNQIHTYEQNLQAQKERKEQIAFLSKSLEQTNTNCKDTREKISQIQTDEEKLKKLVENVPPPIAPETLLAITQQFEAAQEALFQREKLVQKQEHIQKQLVQFQQQSEKQLQTLLQEMSKLRADELVQKYPEATLETAFSKITNAELDLVETQSRLLALSSEIGALEQEIQFTITQGNQLKEKKSKLIELGHHCPLCDQDINDQHKIEIGNKYDQDREQLIQQYQEKKSQHDHLVQEKKKLDLTLHELKVETDKSYALQKVRDIYEQLAQQQNKKEELEHAIDKQRGLFKVEIDQLKAEIAIVTEKAKDFENIKHKRNDLIQQDQQYRQFQEQYVHLNGLKKEFTLLTEVLQKHEEQSKNLQQQIDTLKTNLFDEESMQKTLQEKKVQLTESQLVETQLHQRKNTLTHLKQELLRIQTLSESHNQKLAVLEEEKEAASLLTEAFSYRGVPTMIIEEAIPRLEQYANDILSFLSDNTMTIHFSLSRASKVDKENQIETLDILIGDTFGTRAYELFSGGEAFRIDIALRLALTKLLTERSKGKVEFLVVDEGFGSQDENGRDHIVQIIHKLESFFQLIIVITHVDQLKETFSDRLLITKGPAGSDVIQDQED